MSLTDGKKKKSLPDFSSWVRVLAQANAADASSKQIKPNSGLYLVATPIGNLGDITLRGLWLLQNADLILCEDTRVTGGLLQAYGFQKPLLSCHEYNEEERIKDILVRLERGDRLVLVSDAGTPMISDPGYHLVKACREAGFSVISVPGANAALTALTCAGLPTDRFTFIGFLPTKKSARRRVLEELVSRGETLIFYESPGRLAETLADMTALFSPERRAAVGRELTKLYEEMRVDTLEALAQHYEEGSPPKGEIVILIAPTHAEEEAAREEHLDALLRDALQTLSLRDAVADVVEMTGLKKNQVYQRALALQEQK